MAFPFIGDPNPSYVSPAPRRTKETVRLGPAGTTRPRSAEGFLGDLDHGENRITAVEAYEISAIRV